MKKWIACFLIGAMIAPVYPALVTWQGDESINWGTAGNWDTGALPGIADTAQFDATSVSRCSVDVPINVYRFRMTSAFDSNFTDGGKACTVATNIDWNCDSVAGRKISLTGRWVQTGNGTTTMNPRFPGGITAGLSFDMQGNGILQMGNVQSSGMPNNAFFHDLKVAKDAGDSCYINNTMSFGGTQNLVGAQLTVGLGRLNVDGYFMIRTTDTVPIVIARGGGYKRFGSSALRCLSHLVNVDYIKSNTSTFPQILAATNDVEVHVGKVDTSNLTVSDFTGSSGKLTVYFDSAVYAVNTFNASNNYMTDSTICNTATIEITASTGTYSMIHANYVAANNWFNMMSCNIYNNRSVDFDGLPKRIKILGGTSTITFNGSTNSVMGNTSGAGFWGLQDSIGRGYNDVVVNKTGTGTWSIGVGCDSTFPIQGDLSVTDGGLNIGGKTLKMYNGNLEIDGDNNIDLTGKIVMLGNSAIAHFGSLLGAVTGAGDTLDFRGTSPTLDCDKAITIASLRRSATTNLTSTGAATLTATLPSRSAGDLYQTGAGGLNLAGYTVDSLYVGAGTLASSAGVDTVLGNANIAGGTFSCLGDTVVFLGNVVGATASDVVKNAESLWKIAAGKTITGFDGDTLPTVQFLGGGGF